jgi:hypothetical protein
MRCVLVIASDDNLLAREQVGMRAVGNCRVVTLPVSEKLRGRADNWIFIFFKEMFALVWSPLINCSACAGRQPMQVVDGDLKGAAQRSSPGDSVVARQISDAIFPH